MSFDVSIQISFTPDTLKTLDDLTEALKAFAQHNVSNEITAVSASETEITSMEATTSETVTPEDVQALVRQKMKDKALIPKIKQILADEFHAARVSLLKPEQLVAFKAKLETL